MGSAGAAFFTQIVLARELTPTRYGVFAAALTTVTLVAPLAGFGVQGFWLKSFGAEGWRATRWLSASLRFCIMSTMVVLLLITGWAAWGPHSPTFQRLLFCLMPVVVASLFMELVSGKFQLEERYTALALWQILPQVARLLMICLATIAVPRQISLEGIASIYSAVSLLLVMVGLTSVRDMAYGRLALKGHGRSAANLAPDNLDGARAELRDVVRNAWPFGLAGISYYIYFQSDIILLQYLSGPEAAGVYTVAFNVMAAVYLFPGAIYQRFLLPKIHRWARHDRARFLHVYRVGNGSMLLLGVTATVAIMVLAPIVIPALFGTAYRQAASLLSLLAFCAPVRFLATSVGATLVTQQHMRRKVLYMGVVAVVNVSLNLVLIPLYAAKGAAMATVASECTLLVLYLYAVRRHVFGAEAWRGWTIDLRQGDV